MKITVIILLVLALANGANMRHQKNKKDTQQTSFLQVESEFVGESHDLSGNVGVVSSQETVVNALSNQDRVEKAESKERNAVKNAIKKSHKALVQVTDDVFVEETLDQAPKQEINLADLYTNDGQSPDMGQQAIIEDQPTAPMAAIPSDENLDYIRSIDKLDLLDENGQPLEVLPVETSFLDMTQFESRFQQTDTPQMQPAPSWDNIQTAYEKSPGASELSPDELQRQTDQMVDSLAGELANEAEL